MHDIPDVIFYPLWVYLAIKTDKAGYDASIKEDEDLKYSDISVFQGVRADLDRYAPSSSSFTMRSSNK